MWELHTKNGILSIRVRWEEAVTTVECLQTNVTRPFYDRFIAEAGFASDGFKFASKTWHARKDVKITLIAVAATM